MTIISKPLVRIAALVAFGAASWTSAHAGEAGQNGAQPAAQLVTTAAPARVKMTIGTQRQPDGRMRLTTLDDPSGAAPAKPSGPWYSLDRSLKAGDVVVTEQGALVYEGEKDGRRLFRDVATSRLVTATERETIAGGVR